MCECVAVMAMFAAGMPVRAEASARLDRALETTQLRLVGPKADRVTNLQFLRTVLAAPEFAAGNYDTGLAEKLAKKA